MREVAKMTTSTFVCYEGGRWPNNARYSIIIQPITRYPSTFWHVNLGVTVFLTRLVVVSYWPGSFQ
jgi:hypothetical protein